MSVTIDELEFVSSKIAEMREVVADLSKQKKEAEAELDKIEQHMIDLLSKADKTSYDSRVGRIGIRMRSSVRVPSDRADRGAFFAYLKERGIFDEMISVHSQTLNAWYQQEMDSALERGEIDFRVPGLSEPSTRITLTYTQKK